MTLVLAIALAAGSLQEPTLVPLASCVSDPAGVRRVFVTAAKVDASWVTPVKAVKWSKRWYGGTAGAFEQLALEAAKYRAEAVVEAKAGHGMNGFSWAAPKASGRAVTWTAAGRAAAQTLAGQCVSVPAT